MWFQNLNDQGFKVGGLRQQVWTVLEGWKNKCLKKFPANLQVNEGALDDLFELWKPFYEADGNFFYRWLIKHVSSAWNTKTSKST